MITEIIILIILLILIKLFGKKGSDQPHTKTNWNPYSDYQPINNSGHEGELETVDMLLRIVPNSKIILNAYIPTSDGRTTEIDIIFITEYGIYVIENKDYSGWIFGNQKNKNWCCCYKNGEKHQFYNPVRQNDTHIKWLKKLLNEKRIRYGKIFSIICFNNTATLKDITSTIPVVNTWDLPGIIAKTEKVIGQREIDIIYGNLLPYTHASNSTKQEHIKNIQQYKDQQTI